MHWQRWTESVSCWVYFAPIFCEFKCVRACQEVSPGTPAGVQRVHRPRQSAPPALFSLSPHGGGGARELSGIPFVRTLAPLGGDLSPPNTITLGL